MRDSINNNNNTINDNINNINNNINDINNTMNHNKDSVRAEINNKLDNKFDLWKHAMKLDVWNY
jgi:uncharacterized protein YukE